MRTKIVLWIALIVLAGANVDAEETRLLRFADVHESTIAFVYAGDIWTVPTTGGQARRLTSHEGMELFPKFSPDGRQIAFSAEYGGNRQVFVMPVEGGTPRQLTFYNDVGPMPPRGGFDYQVMDWTPDGEHVLFRANRLPWGVRMGRPYTVPVDGGMEQPLAVPEGGGGMYSPDGKYLVYTPIARAFRTWKRHRGGRAQDVWIFDLELLEAEQITDFDGTDNQPVWVGDTIYFTSDRDDRLNLYSYNVATTETRKVTDHTKFDVLWPSAGPDKVVYECGGYLYLFDPFSGKSTRVNVEVSGDYLQTMPRIADVSDRVQSAAISPNAKRAVFTARGDVFTVPAEHGETRNLTRTPGIREMNAEWSPDGRLVSYLSDRSGEYELYVRPRDGSGEERQLTRNTNVWMFTPRWSPDSKKLVVGDMKQRLRWIDVETGDVSEIDRGEYQAIFSYRWAPDSNWIVYDKVEQSRFNSLYVYSIATGESYRLTDDTTNDFGATFDPDGRYLYFLSDRDFNLTFSGYEFNYFYTDPTRIYVAALNDEVESPLAARNDEEQPEDETADEESAEADDGEEQPEADEADEAEENEPLEIEVERFAERVLAIPGDPGNYGGLEATATALFYVTGDAGERQIQMFSLEKEEAETVLEGAGGFELSRDGSKLFYVQGDNYGIVDAQPGQKPKHLSLDGLQLKIDPRAEWEQIFNDAWRITRDWFYDANMHGIDWKAMRKLYAPLVDHVVHRGDLDYILGEMGGELNAGHYYVNWGDMPRPERVNNGLLGAEIEADESGYFRVVKIFEGENWQPEFRSPLTETGVNVAEGDYILAVDGRSTRDVKNFYELLEARSGDLVRLQVNGKPSTEDAREERVRPIARETNLRYLDWVASRRARVDELSGGRIGYIHLPNTATDGNRELRKHFYPQTHKEALIIDVRYNGGGFIPDRMIELVARTQLSFWARRGIEPMRTPGYAHNGPKACLINGYSSSGGDAFPYYFSKLGLGPLLGTRTWGGLIGLSGNPGFIDGGSVAVPTFRFYDTEGQWAVEGVGVPPDIEVVDRPDVVARGQDPTLERAVAVLLESLAAETPRDPDVPDAPRLKR